MAGMMFMVTIPTECAENKLNTKSHVVPEIIVTNENQQMPSRSDRKCTAGVSRSLENNHTTSRPQKASSCHEVSINISSTPLLRIGKSSKGYRHLDAEEPAKIKSTPTINETNSIRKSWEGFKDIVSSSKRTNSSDRKRTDGVDNAHAPNNNGFLGISRDSSMEAIMNEMMKKLHITNSVWQKSRDEAFHQITFSVEADHRYKLVLSTLDEWGIGHRNGSCVSVIPCAVYNSPTQHHDEKNPKDFCEEWILAQKQTAWERFLSSIRARLNVAQIVQAVKEDATLTFDFVTLIIVASSLAAFGLVENSMILLVSSMLISPLMGPIIATIFGIVIEDRSLIRFGSANELFGVLLATTVGFFFGLIVYSLDLYSHKNDDGLVTIEMLSRCEIHSLIVGVLTALPSGAAVAIAILGENIGSLVGVAISASILPPAVNTGILWSMAALHSFGMNDKQIMIKSNYYSDHQAIELAIHGALSMLLTIVNIACIFLMGVLVLKIKEVAPIITKHHRQFWKHDIKLARDYNNTLHANEEEFTQKLAEEINEMQQAGDYTADLLRNINRKTYQNTWSPSIRHSSIVLATTKDRRPSLADLEKICAHLTASPNKCDRLRAAAHYASGANKSYANKSMSPTAPFRTLKDEQMMRKKLKSRYVSSTVLPTPKSKGTQLMNVKGNHLMNVSEINQSASTNSTVFETVPNTSMCDDNASVKSSTTTTPINNSQPKKPIRKFIVTPATEPL